MRQQKIEEFRDRFANPYVAAERGFVDAVIQPRETRKKLIQALEMLETSATRIRQRSTGTYRCRNSCQLLVVSSQNEQLAFGS